jgi:hypothetical protein
MGWLYTHICVLVSDEGFMWLVDCSDSCLVNSADLVSGGGFYVISGWLWLIVLICDSFRPLLQFLYFLYVNRLFLNEWICLSGVVSLSQALCSSDDYSNSLLHLDLSKNPGILSGEDATVRPAHQHATCTRTRTHRCSLVTHAHTARHTRTRTHTHRLLSFSLSVYLSAEHVPVPSPAKLSGSFGPLWDRLHCGLG